MRPNIVFAPGRWIAAGLTLSAAWSVLAASVALGLGQLESDGMPPATATTWSAERPIALWRVDPCTGEDLAVAAYLSVSARSWSAPAGLRVDAHTRLGAFSKLGTDGVMMPAVLERDLAITVGPPRQSAGGPVLRLPLIEWGRDHHTVLAVPLHLTADADGGLGFSAATPMLTCE